MTTQGKSKNEVGKAIEQLKKDGYSVEFAHWRMYTKRKYRRYSRKMKWLTLNGWEDTGQQPLSKGGKTVCTIYKGDVGYDARGVTRCNTNEQFSYAQGRRKALVRAIEELVEIGDVDVDTYNALRGELYKAIRDYWKERGISCKSQDKQVSTST